MYFTDFEIYKSINRGISEKILAELNCCKLSEIAAAYKRYKDKVNQRNNEYMKTVNFYRDTKVVKPAKPHSKPVSKIENITCTQGRTRFVYDDNIDKKIKAKILTSQSIRSIYYELFGDSSEYSSKPCLKAFYAHCGKLKSIAKLENFQESINNESS